jgi:hypothetical protein
MVAKAGRTLQLRQFLFQAARVPTLPLQQEPEELE